MQTSAHMPTAQLARRLGFWSVVGIGIGVTIGSGIFRTPSAIATRVPDPMLMLAVWVLGGLISLCGALSFAELAAALPYTGGFYVYLRESWGRLLAFLFGWSQLVLIRASAIGAISAVFSEYLLRSLGYDPAAHGTAADCIAAAAIVGTAAANIRGVRLGVALVGVSTGVKFGALALMVLVSAALGGAVGGTTAHFTANGGPVEAGLFGLGLISVLWAYDGFADASYVSGEVTDTRRALPLAIITGTFAIVAIYLAVNVAYLYVNPIDRIARSPLIAADTMGTIFGSLGVAMISVVVTISTFGALMSTMLTAPRTFFAMANDGLLFRRLAGVHPQVRHTLRGHSARRRARRGIRVRANVRATDGRVCTIDLAVLWFCGRRPVPAASHETRAVSPLPSARLSLGSCGVRRGWHLPRRECARHGSAADRRDLRRHSCGRSGVLPCVQRNHEAREELLEW